MTDNKMTERTGTKGQNTTQKTTDSAARTPR